MRSSNNVEAWDPNRVLGELDKLIVSAVPEHRPSLVVALAARLAQLGVGLVAPTTTESGGTATTEAERPSPFLSTEEAGVYLGLSPRTLERLRFEGRGPAYRKHGRIVVYRREALDAWSEVSAQQPDLDRRPRMRESR
jgi:excisionase family DNA binding protein